MLQHLSQYLTQPSTKTGDSDPRSAYFHALYTRAVADADLRDAEAAIWQIADPKPDLQKGEVWAKRPAPWAQGALSRRFFGPEPGSAVAPSLKVYHDCPLAQFSLHQSLASQRAPAPFSLSVDVLHFDGSFLSLCLNLDGTETADWHKQDVIRVTLEARMEARLPIYARLNLKQGPNTLQQLAEFGFGDTLGGRRAVGFDLAYAGLGPEAVDAVWVDLILEKPAMNAVHLDDVTLSRSKRADL